MQYNITRILHKSSSNRMFCSIHDFTFLMTDTKIKEHVPFESWEKKIMSERLSVKFVMLPVQSITLANWFACMRTITQVSLTSLDRQILIITCLFRSTGYELFRFLIFDFWRHDLVKSYLLWFHWLPVSPTFFQDEFCAQLEHL